jgi:hypothetical protein
MIYEVNYNTSSGNRTQTDQSFTKREAETYAREKNKKSPGSNARAVKINLGNKRAVKASEKDRRQTAAYNLKYYDELRKKRGLTGMKKTTKRKPAAKKKSSRVGGVGSGLKKYNTFIKNAPGVKSAETRLKKLEADIKAVKKKKAAAKKVAAKKYAAKRK